MADIAQLEQALIKADAAAQAGSSTAVDDAKVLAAEIRRIRSTDAKPPAAPSMLDNAASAVKTMADKDPMVGSVETLLNLGTGMAGSVAGGISGLGTVATNALGLTNTPPAERVEQVQQALTYEPRTASGRVGTKIATFLPEKVAELGDAGGKRVTDMAAAAGVPPWLAAELGTRMNVGTQAIPALLARGARGSVGETPASLAERQKRQALNAPVDEGIVAARKAGLKITPTQAEAGGVARTLESVAGSERLQKMASEQNAPRINAIIRKDVGIAENEPLTRDVLAKVRAEAGKKYEALKNSGEVTTDAQYQADLHAITKSYETAEKGFPTGQVSPFQTTLDSLKQKSFDAASGVEKLRLLRESADKAFAGKDAPLGRAYKQAASALEDMLDRHVQRTGSPQLLTEFQEARRLIAKTYAAEKALNETTGNINANVYAAELKKGKPLTGGAETVAQFARQFPGSARIPERVGATGPTFADVGLAAIGKDALLALPRPLARHGLMSAMAQNSLTTPRSYGSPVTGRLAKFLSEQEIPAATAFPAAGQKR